MRELEDREPYASEPCRGMNSCNLKWLFILTRRVVNVLHEQTGSVGNGLPPRIIAGF